MIESFNRLDWDLRHGNSVDLVNLAQIFLNSEYSKYGTKIKWSSKIFMWKIGQSNPYGEGQIFCAVIEGKVYATLSLTLKNIMINDEKFLVAEIGDSYTHPTMLSRSFNGVCNTPIHDLNYKSEFIKKSVFGRLVAEATIWAKNRGVKIIYGTPNSKSSAGYIKRLGFKLINSEIDEIFMRTIPTAALIKCKIKIPKFIYFLIKLLLHSLLELVFFIPKIAFQLKGYVVSQTASDSSINMLWAEYSKNKLTIPRDFEWLSWRYLSHPSDKYNIYYMTLNGEVKGWVVIKNEIINARNQITIADWFVGRDKLSFVGFLFIVLIKINYQNNVIKFWVSEDSSILNFFLKLSSFRIYPVNLIFKSLDNSSENQKIESINEFCLGLSDNI
jgi:hypothetical protein